MQVKLTLFLYLIPHLTEMYPSHISPLCTMCLFSQIKKKGIVAALNLAAMGFKAQMQHISHENIKIITLLTNPNRKKLEYIGVGKSAGWK